MTAPCPSRAQRRWLAGGLLALVGLLFAPGTAGAHSVLESSDPVDGAHVDELPDTVTLVFGEPILLDGASISVATERTSVRLSALALDEAGTTLSAPIGAASLATGAVTIEWAAVSADGHPISGDIAVGVGPGAVAASAPRPSTPGDPHLVEGIVTADRMVGYLGLAILTGGLAFLVVLWPEGAGLARTRRLLWAAWGGALAATVVGIGLQAATVRGSVLGKAVDTDALASVLDSPFGRAWGARALLLLLAVPLLVALGRWGGEVVRAPWFLVPAAAVTLGLLRTMGLVSHAGEGDLGPVGSVADLVHLLGVVTWLGGLVVLVTVVLPRRRTVELARVVPAFSRLALGAIVAIVVAGTVMAWDLAGSFDALSTTEWGRLLVTKIVLFAVVLVTAQVSKRWVLDRLALAVALRGHLVLVRPFVLTVAAETLLAASILGVASALVTTSPGR